MATAVRGHQEGPREPHVAPELDPEEGTGGGSRSV